MGNAVSGSKDRHIDESVDFGSLGPQGVYTGPQDWNQQVVGHLIVDRRLAPFYKPLEEYEESWDDDHILAARKDSPNTQPPAQPEPPGSASATSPKYYSHRHPNKAGKEPFRPTEASVYRGAVECPICFLYYPPNINRSRCCDQAICTECFVQIKRAEPTTTHLVSEPASCPYCVQENFGVTYAPPDWRTGLMRDGQPAPPAANIQKANSRSSADSNGTKRRKSFGADSPDVVTIDQIRPDWEAKLAAVRAAVTRRANRRIIMRQVGDRLIPIGVTSGRTLAEAAADGVSGHAEGPEGGSGRRSRRRGNGGQDLNQLLGSVGLGGQDLEELMMMEAMRLSLLEHDEQQRRQNNQDNHNGNDPGNAVQGNSGVTNGNNTSPGSSVSPSPRSPPSPSTSVPIPAPRESSAQSPADTPSRSPVRSRFPITPSPLGNTSNAVDTFAVLGSAPPGTTSHPTPNDGNLLIPPARYTHRRAGSNPGPPSGNTIVAALNTVQMTSACLIPSMVGRPGSGIPRSAPATRAASPHPLQREVDALAGGGTAQAESEAPPPVPELACHQVPSSSPSVPSTSPVLAGIQTPASEVGEETLLGGYQPLPSSLETSDPLLDWGR